MKKVQATILVTALACFISARAEVKLAAMFGDNMVLQRDTRVTVWGTANPGEEATVEFAGQKKTAKAGADGKWRVVLSSMRASAEPRMMTVTGSTKGAREELHGILVGDVWLCSGQSNMEKPIGETRNQKPPVNYKQELAAADCPQIRLFKVQKAM